MFGDVTLVVLGDIGHSPRMNYHALSLAREGFAVNLVGYRGSTPQRALLSNPLITLRYLPSVGDVRWIRPKLLQYMVKVILQSFVLTYFLLVNIPKVTHFLVQNPPTIPAFYVIWFVSIIRQAEFIIDWHNFGYTILSLTLGNNHPFVRVNRWIEKVFGRRAQKSLCVSEAMKEYLSQEWGIKNCALLYDRPPDRFQVLSLEEKHEVFNAMAERYPPFASDTGNVFTEAGSDGHVIYRAERPALVVSSSSWTEDEDFGLLLSSLKEYDDMAARDGAALLPRVVCCITGKGPLKEWYRGVVSGAGWRHVDVVLPWLSAEEYPRVVGAADLGVSLHTSSSGLDLPMKVVDMFGCGLPVCAVRYRAIGELVRDDINGRLFTTAPQLTALLAELLHRHPERLANYRRYLLQHAHNNTWHNNWTEVALPLFKPRGNSDG